MKCQILFYNRLNFLLRQRLFRLNPKVADMNQSCFNFLMFLYQSDGYELSLRELESELQQSQSGINEISLYLENSGFIERFKDPEDKRRLKARLTEKGTAFALEIEDEFKKEEDKLLEGVSEEDKETYIRVAKQIYENGRNLLNGKVKSNL